MPEQTAPGAVASREHRSAAPALHGGCPCSASRDRPGIRFRYTRASASRWASWRLGDRPSARNDQRNLRRRAPGGHRALDQGVVAGAAGGGLAIAHGRHRARAVAQRCRRFAAAARTGFRHRDAPGRRAADLACGRPVPGRGRCARTASGRDSSTRSLRSISCKLSSQRPMMLPDAEACSPNFAEQIRRDAGPRIALVGIYTGGVWMAERLHRMSGAVHSVGTIDVAFYRDDFKKTGLRAGVKPSDIPFPGRGRATSSWWTTCSTPGARSAQRMNEIFDYGRPASIRLAALVDRGGRQLPICPQFVGAAVEVAARSDDRATARPVPGD